MASEAVSERAVPAPPDAAAARAPVVPQAAVADAPAEAASPARPYPRSWLNVLIDAIDRAPVPAWSIYLVATIVSIVGSLAQAWLSGLLAPGELEPTAVFWGVMTVSGFWIVHYLDRVARSSFDAFRPLLDDPPEAIARLRYELVVIPAIPALVLTVVGFAATLLGYAADPEGSAVVGLSPAAMVVRTLAEGTFAAVLVVLAYHTYRQLRRVSALHARARGIDLFRPGPLYAFSRLTAQTGMVFIVVMALGYIANPQAFDGGSIVLWLPWLVGLPLLGVVAFIAPLWGMHRRLVAEKDRLGDEAGHRLKRLLGEIDRDVDAGDLSRADGLNKTLASMLQQREVVAKLPTWPWSSATIRGFGTAIMLPLVLFVVQRLLSQYV